MPAPIHHKYSIEDYWKLAKRSSKRQEYHNGLLVPFEQNDFVQTAIAINISSYLQIHAHKKALAFISSGEQCVVTPRQELVAYPDVFGSCEAPSTLKDTPAICNPTFIIEVSTNKSALADHTTKLRGYLQIPSLAEYHIIACNHTGTTSYLKDTKSRKWIYSHSPSQDDVLRISCVKTEIPLDTIFKDGM